MAKLTQGPPPPPPKSFNQWSEREAIIIARRLTITIILGLKITICIKRKKIALRKCIVRTVSY